MFFFCIFWFYRFLFCFLIIWFFWIFFLMGTLLLLDLYLTDTWLLLDWYLNDTWLILEYYLIDWYLELEHQGSRITLWAVSTTSSLARVTLLKMIKLLLVQFKVNEAMGYTCASNEGLNWTIEDEMAVFTQLFHYSSWPPKQPATKVPLA